MHSRRAARLQASVLRWALAASLVLASVAFGEPKRSAKEEADALVRAMLPRAVEAIEKRAFYPLGASSSDDGTVWYMPPYADRATMTPQQVLDRLLNVSLQNRALEAGVQAVAACFDARMAPPGRGKDKVDVIAFYVDHRNDYSVSVYFPYQLDAAGKVVLGKAFSAWGTRRVYFPARKSKR